MPERTVQRLRDPLYDIIEFKVSGRGNQLETALWKVLQTRPLQRLRRIKQLGFSDMVYPGATHSRFAHSVGTFTTARHLLQIVKDQHKTPDEAQENRALAAALLHDVGHGPFSHAFEAACKQLAKEFGEDIQMSDHEVVTERLIRHEDVAAAFASCGLGSDFADTVSKIISKKTAPTIHNAVVSSQFDADRLDFLQRDRLMTGVQHSALDFKWLMANLSLGEIEETIGDPDDTADTGPKVTTFGLTNKAVQAAEGYVLSYIHLYQTVYFHKTTRGAECLFTELMCRIFRLVRGNDARKTGLPRTHPLIQFCKSPNDLENILNLDDPVIWGALSMLEQAEDPLVKEFSARLKYRKLYGCYDIRKNVEATSTGSIRGSKSMVTDGFFREVDKRSEEILKAIKELRDNNKSLSTKILVDDAKKSPYKDQGNDLLDRIYIFGENGGYHDLAACSTLVKGLRPFAFARVYVDRESKEAIQAVNGILEEQKCARMKGW